MKKKICPICQGTGLSSIRVDGGGTIGKFNCPECDGNGFILTDTSEGDDFSSKKFIDGVETVYFRKFLIQPKYQREYFKSSNDRLHQEKEYKYPIMIGKIPYEDFFEGNITAESVTLFPNAKKYFCPAELEGLLNKECESLFCSCNKTPSTQACPFKYFQRRVEKIRSYCWQMYDTSPTSPTLNISLTEAEQKLLEELLDSLFCLLRNTFRLRDLRKDKETLCYTYLSLKKKLKSQSGWDEDLLFSCLGLPIEDPIILAEKRQEDEEIAEEIAKHNRAWLSAAGFNRLPAIPLIPADFDY